MSETTNDPSSQAERVRSHAQAKINELRRRAGELSVGADPLSAELIQRIADAGRVSIIDIVHYTETTYGADFAPINVDPGLPPREGGSGDD